MESNNVTATTETFDAALHRFMTTVQVFLDQHYLQSSPRAVEAGIPGPRLSIDAGRKYYRIVRNDGASRSVYCFIDTTNGDVLKAAGWKAPAKTARGNICAADIAGYGVTPYGAAYR